MYVDFFLHMPIPFYLFLFSFLPLFFRFLSTRDTSFENVTAAVLSYNISHLYENTGKLRKTSVPNSRSFNDASRTHS